jgi:hypothetical protein
MVWEKRVAVADMKRKFPTLGIKEDEELLHDKERVLKRPPKNDSHARYDSFSSCFELVFLIIYKEASDSNFVLGTTTWHRRLDRRSYGLRTGRS